MVWFMRRIQLVELVVALTCGVGAGLVVVLLTSLDVPLKVIALMVGALVGLIAALITRDIKRLLLTMIFVDIATGFDFHLTCNEDFFLSSCGLNISVTLIALVVLYARWIISVRRGNTDLLVRRPELGPIGVLGAAFVWWMIVSIMAASETEFAVYLAWVYISAFLLFYYLANNIANASEMLFIVYLLAFGLAIQVAAIELQSLGLLSQGGPEHFLSRFPGTLYSPNVAGGYLAQMLLIVLAFLLSRMSGRRQWLLALLVIVTLDALIATQSRGAWTSVTVGFLILLGVGLWKKWISIRSLIMILLAVALAAAFFSDRIITRLTEDDRGAADARTPLAEIALNMIRANPVVGVGPNNFGIVLHDYVEIDQYGAWLHIVHNNWLLVWSETGTVGLILYVILWLLILWQAFKLIQSGHPLYSFVALGLFASLVGAGVNMLSQTFSGRVEIYIFWTDAALITAMTRLQRQTSQADVQLPTAIPQSLVPRAATHRNGT